MAKVRKLHRSFSGGILTPELFGQTEMAKYNTGLRRCENCLVLPHGPVTRRPGTQFVNECHDSSLPVRLIPFVFNAQQAFVLEFGHFYVRFHTLGATLLESNKTITAVTQASPSVFTVPLHGYLDGDQVFLQGVPNWPQLDKAWYRVKNFTLNTFTLERMDGTPVSTALLSPYTGASGTVARSYLIGSPYSSADLFDLNFAQSADVLTITHPNYDTQELRRQSATVWSFQTVSFAPSLYSPVSVSVSPTIVQNQYLQNDFYVVTAVGLDGVTESLPSSEISAANNLSLAGNFNTITWGVTPGASRYYVYKRKGGVYGYIGQRAGLSLVDNNVTPDTDKTPPENNITLNTGPNDRPAAVTNYEQRRFFAGTYNKPQTIWATRSGTDSNLTSSTPSGAADAVEFRVASSQLNAIRHLRPLSDLVVFTEGAIYRVFSDNSSGWAIDTLSVKPMSYAGASKVQPVDALSALMYVQAQGSYIREFAYTDAGEGFVGYRDTDRSIFAPHLFDGYTIKQLAFSRAPLPCLWAVRSDGVLLGLTHVPEHEVFAWHQHDTQGKIESIAVVPENNEDVLYMVVNRTMTPYEISREARYVERMVSRRFTEASQAFYVDAGYKYTNNGLLVINGLHHLSGSTVEIYGDGAVLPSQVVQDGSIVLDKVYHTVHVGLGYKARVQLLPFVSDQLEAMGQGQVKNVVQAHVRVHQSSAFKVGTAFDKLTTNRERQVTDDYDDPPALKNRVYDVPLSSDWEHDASLCFESVGPLPMTLLSVVADVEVGG